MSRNQWHLSYIVCKMDETNLHYSQKEDSYMSIGDRIRSRRQELGLSQHDLADQTGVSRPTIAQLETGVRLTMNTDTAKALARGLGVSVDYLIGTWEESEGNLKPAALDLVSA
jgi:transcriptional regulator with XRE-family HTH domain